MDPTIEAVNPNIIILSPLFSELNHHHQEIWGRVVPRIVENQTTN